MQDATYVSKAQRLSRLKPWRRRGNDAQNYCAYRAKRRRRLLLHTSLLQERFKTCARADQNSTRFSRLQDGEALRTYRKRRRTQTQQRTHLCKEKSIKHLWAGVEPPCRCQYNPTLRMWQIKTAEPGIPEKMPLWIFCRQINMMQFSSQVHAAGIARWILRDDASVVCCPSTDGCGGRTRWRGGERIRWPVQLHLFSSSPLPEFHAQHVLCILRVGRLHLRIYLLLELFRTFSTRNQEALGCRKLEPWPYPALFQVCDVMYFLGVLNVFQEIEIITTAAMPSFLQ